MAFELMEKIIMIIHSWKNATWNNNTMDGEIKFDNTQSYQV